MVDGRLWFVYKIGAKSFFSGLQSGMSQPVSVTLGGLLLTHLLGEVALDIV